MLRMVIRRLSVSAIRRHAPDPLPPRSPWLEKFVQKYINTPHYYEKPGYPLSLMPYKSWSKWRLFWVATGYVASFTWIGFAPWHLLMASRMPYMEVRPRDES